MRRKEYGWFVGLVYDPTEMLEVTTVRPGVAGVLHHKRVEISVNIFLTAITTKKTCKHSNRTNNQMQENDESPIR
jgi:hypothetical protein